MSGLRSMTGCTGWRGTPRVCLAGWRLASGGRRRCWRVRCAVGSLSISNTHNGCALLRRASLKTYNECVPKGDHTAPASFPHSSHIPPTLLPHPSPRALLHGIPAGGSRELRPNNH